MAKIPEGATVPQDHQTKTEKPKVENVQIEVPELDAKGMPTFDDDGNQKTRTVDARRTTVNDIEVTVLEEALDDFELLDDIRAAGDNGDASRLPSLLRRLVGDDYKRILDELRDPVTHRVSAAKGSQFVWDVFGALNPNS
ncbi:hypothetical protein IFU40_06075 [Microbacterium sp. CFBP 13617]|uniref:hypothetical protein n=1 Tax=Microbacterium sp. CFBP 13617 TaxID=2774035 RepID=UPI001785D62C|nr:hypothetical protein [Microbacterium sp. CFBP 13617]MBD8218199.1 hypothetical protein [Microbacterium sp. CFBP 13617]